MLTDITRNEHDNRQQAASPCALPLYCMEHADGVSHAFTRMTTSARAARHDIVSMRTASKLRVTLRESEAAAKCLLIRSCMADHKVDAEDFRA